MSNTLEMLKALDEHLRSLCRNPAESKVLEYFVTAQICCVCSSERQHWELPQAFCCHWIWGHLHFLREGCHSVAVPAAL